MKKLLMKPLKVLASPGIYLFDKYNQYKRERQESKKNLPQTEDELFQLNIKIDKLLNKLNEKYAEVASSPDEECVICVNAKAVMQTFPCGHNVVCRRCFVRTIQMALSQRTLPLRCVICRTKILRLRQTPNSKLVVNSFCHSRSSTYSASKRSQCRNNNCRFNDNICSATSKYSKSLPGISGNSFKYQSSVSRSYSTVVYRKSSGSTNKFHRSCSLSNYRPKNCRLQTSATQSIKSEVKTVEDKSPSEQAKEVSLNRRKEPGLVSRDELIHKFQKDFREGQLSARSIQTKHKSLLYYQPPTSYVLSKQMKIPQKHDSKFSGSDKHKTFEDNIVYEDTILRDKGTIKAKDKMHSNSCKLFKMMAKRDKSKYQKDTIPLKMRKIFKVNEYN